MKEQFKNVRLAKESMARLNVCLDIIKEYTAQGFRLTLRQLYYQLVSRNQIPNAEREYRRLSRLISDARLAGLLDWNAIEDRIRQPRMQIEFNDLRDLVEAALASYRLPRWRGQKHYVELWVEKDALAGVLEPLARQYHVTMMVNRGYSSQSAMYEAYRRFLDAGGAGGKYCTILYLGDHDPSGEDMVRDIANRLQDIFSVNVDIVKVALTMAQVQKYNPPPNPAKMEDPRANDYVAQHGYNSWEVDALPPNVLAQLIKQEFRRRVNKIKMDDVIEQEKRDKERLRSFVVGKKL